MRSVIAAWWTVGDHHCALPVFARLRRREPDVLSGQQRLYMSIEVLLRAGLGSKQLSLASPGSTPARTPSPDPVAIRG